MKTLRRLSIASLALLLAACPGGGDPAPAPAPVTPNVAASVDAGANEAQSAAAAAALAKLPKLAVVLQDPRLSAVRDRERAKDPATAAHLLDEAIAAPAQASLDARALSNWTYVAARLHLAAGETALAQAAFDKALTDTELGPYASLRASQAYARAGRFPEALARAEAARGATKLDDEELVALAEALAGTGDRAGAVPLWRATLAAHPRGSRWVDSALRLADAILDQMSSGATDAYNAASAREARDLATRVMVETPKVSDGLGAPALRARAVALLAAHGEHDAGNGRDLPLEAIGRRAQAWLDQSDAGNAFEDAETVLHAKPAASKATLCKVSIVRAQAAGKLRGKDKRLLGKLGDAESDPWGPAITACEGDDAEVTALNGGAKASVSGKRTNEALDRYAKLEKEFPDHRLADDARFQSAILVQGSGDEAHAYDVFVSLADAYPNGDMKTEALFRAAMIKMGHGDWEGAKVPLDRSVALDPNDRHWNSAGRAAYFRARAAAATGDVEGAREGFRSVVVNAPLSFYMTQAYARLHALDASSAERALADALAKDDGGTFPSREHPELESIAFRRGCRLLEVGEIEAAKRELAAAINGGSATALPASVAAPSDAGVDASADGSLPFLSSSSAAPSEGSDSELTWIVAWLFDTSGAPELGHSYVRGKLTDFLGHYPTGAWRIPWEVAFPRAYGDLVERESATRGIPSALTWAIMREESSFYPEAKSGANAFGLMQLVPPTARGLGKSMNIPTDDASLVKPEISIALGARLLSQLRGQFSKAPALAIAAYNAGGGAVGRWVGNRRGDDFDLFVERIPYEETRGYEKRVLASEAAYGYLYNKSAFDETLSLTQKVE